MSKEENRKMDLVLYEVLAQAVFEGSAYLKFSQICSELSIDSTHGDFRKVDRSLQRLRKNGAVKFDKKLGWTTT